MVEPLSLPCPACGKLNEIRRKSCTTCGYEFVSPSDERDQGSLLKRMAERLTGHR